MVISIGWGRGGNVLALPVPKAVSSTPGNKPVGSAIWLLVAACLNMVVKNASHQHPSILIKK